LKRSNDATGVTPHPAALIDYPLRALDDLVGDAAEHADEHNHRNRHAASLISSLNVPLEIRCVIPTAYMPDEIAATVAVTE
jgi:hypothetical protein